MIRIMSLLRLIREGDDVLTRTQVLVHGSCDRARKLCNVRLLFCVILHENRFGEANAYDFKGGDANIRSPGSCAVI
ncbi:hypothetical protein TNCV_3342131 [Trichonephila clavipes]|nr:hypothetical protein TNCV_3342131 [Trichonephila clavipes]